MPNTISDRNAPSMGEGVSIPHIQFVSVDKDVKLEVVDWGGSGRVLVLLAALGHDAHVFDNFVLKLIPSYHVYGITRRGFGASSAPSSGYSSDRLGDDVLAVLDSLKLDRPVLVGHSIGGEELSSVGTRYPGKVAGLIYLDAAYGYAYYNPSRGHLDIDLNEFIRKLKQLQQRGEESQDRIQLIEELLKTDLPRMEKDLQEELKDLQTMPSPLRTARKKSPTSEVIQAIFAGEQKYTHIPVPCLAIYAVPQYLAPSLGGTPAEREAYQTRREATIEAQIKAFKGGNPLARVIRLRNANHYIFLSHEEEVLREMHAFINSLP